MRYAKQTSRDQIALRWIADELLLACRRWCCCLVGFLAGSGYATSCLDSADSENAERLGDLLARMAAFDPYHKWLGIPPRDQPPHHYRLLGVELFEADPEVIEAAADRHVAFLQSVTASGQIADAQRLLNEISAARRSLLNPQSRATYDAELKAKLEPAEPPTPAPSKMRETTLLSDIQKTAPAPKFDIDTRKTDPNPPRLTVPAGSSTSAKATTGGKPSTVAKRQKSSAGRLALFGMFVVLVVAGGGYGAYVAGLFNSKPPEVTVEKQRYEAKAANPRPTGLAALGNVKAMLAHYKFEKSDLVADSDKDRHGMNHGATAVDDPVRGGVVAFDGKDDYIELPLELSGDATVAFWMKSNQGISFAYKWQDSMPVLTAAHDLRIAVGGSNLGVSAKGDERLIDSGFMVSDNAWHFVAVTRRASDKSLVIYVDGRSKLQNRWDEATSPAGKLMVGRSELGGKSYEGQIDDLRVYTGALSSDEIAKMFDETKPKPPPAAAPAKNQKAPATQTVTPTTTPPAVTPSAKGAAPPAVTPPKAAAPVPGKTPVDVKAPEKAATPKASETKAPDAKVTPPKSDATKSVESKSDAKTPEK